MNNQLHFAPFPLEDIDQLLQFEAEIFPVHSRERKDVFESRLTLYPEGCFKLMEGNTAIGYMTTELWDEVHDMPINRRAEVCHTPNGHIVFVSSLGISPEFQGGGRGTFFMKEFIRMMKEREFQAIYLRPMKKAIRFYERLGFVKVGEGFDDEQYDKMRLGL